MHNDFISELAAITPNDDYLGLARALAKDIYIERVRDTNADRNTKLRRIDQLENDKLATFDSFSKATSDTVRQMCEQKIDQLTTEQESLRQQISEPVPELIPFDQAFVYVADLLGNSVEVWNKGDLEMRRRVLDITFAGRFSYDKEQKFRTPELSQIYGWFRHPPDDKSEMVPATGLEPATL